MKLGKFPTEFIPSIFDLFFFCQTLNSPRTIIKVKKIPFLLSKYKKVHLKVTEIIMAYLLVIPGIFLEPVC